MRKFVLPIVLIAYFMLLLDNSIIFTGLVKMAEEFKLDAAGLSWISNAYALTFGGFILLGGKLGDLYGRKVMLMVGLAIFTIASFVIGAAPSAIILDVARAFQGVGSAVLAPTTMALLIDTFEGQERVKAISLYGATAGIGASAGLVVGGLLADMLSWRYGFFLNVPIGILMIALCAYALKNHRKASGTLDILGTILSVPGMAFLVYAIVGKENTRFFLIGAIVLLLLFFISQVKGKHPMMPIRLYNNRVRLGGFLARFLYLGAMMGFWFYTSQIMQTQLNFTPLEAGFAFFPLTICNFISAMQVAKFTHKFGNGKVLLAGILITLIGLTGLAFFNPAYGYWVGIMIPMVFLGIGQGFSLSPLTVAGVHNVEAQAAGSASGVVNMMHQFGGSIGLSIIVALSAGYASQVVSFNHAMIVASVLMFVALIICGVCIMKGENHLAQ